MNKKILIVEDEFQIREILEEFLKESGYEVDEAEDGVEGLKLFNDNHYDLVITDVMMPNMDGFELVERIREYSNVPIIVLTALSSESDQARGYDIAADDYITKPFSPLILVKKVDGMFRRLGSNKKEDGAIRLGDIVIDKNAWSVSIKNQMFFLSVKEFDLFFALVEKNGEVLTREWLLRNVWGYEFIGDARIVDTQIKNIRKKLGNSIIETVHGVGYRIIKNGKIENEEKN